MHIVKGCPRDKWEEVQAIQHEPFIYIMGNGSKWAGEEEDDLPELLTVLATHPLDPRFETFYTINPCEGIKNPDYCPWERGNTEPAYLNGPRFYQCEAARFFGNFLTISHGFSIDTNDPATIEQLVAAIQANQKTKAYADAKKEIAAAQRAKRGRK